MTSCPTRNPSPLRPRNLLFRAALLLATATQLQTSVADDSTQARKSEKEGPRIQFASMTNDFGRIIESETRKHEFFFTNSGTQPLFILEVKSSCGCTTALGLGKVEPGQEGRIPTEFFSSGMEGPFDEHVLVSCNDPEKPQIALHLKGTVWRPITVTPPTVGFREKLESAASMTRVLKIKNQEKEPLVLSAPRTSHKAFVASLKPVKEGQEYELTVRLAPPLGGGNVFGDVQMNTSLRSIPLLKIPVWVISQGGVLVFPAKLELMAGPLSQDEVRKITIQNNLASALELREPAVNVPGAEAWLIEEEKGQKFTVTLTFPKGCTLPPAGAELSLRSNQTGSPVIKVPITGMP